jgi:hypothetical protein
LVLGIDTKNYQANLISGHVDQRYYEAKTEPCPLFQNGYAKKCVHYTIYKIN